MPRAACGPPPSGIRTSTSATSGRFDSAIRIASSASAGRADQLDPFLVAEELRERDPEAGLVVGEEHPDGIVLAANDGGWFRQRPSRGTLQAEEGLLKHLGSIFAVARVGVTRMGVSARMVPRMGAQDGGTGCDGG